MAMKMRTRREPRINIGKGLTDQVKRFIEEIDSKYKVSEVYLKNAESYGMSSDVENLFEIDTQSIVTGGSMSMEVLSTILAIFKGLEVVTTGEVRTFYKPKLACLPFFEIMTLAR